MGISRLDRSTECRVDLLIVQVFFPLQHLKRTGWVRKGVHEPESVASHMYRMAMMAFLFGDGGIDSSVDRVRCVDPFRTVLALLYAAMVCIGASNSL